MTKGTRILAIKQPWASLISEGIKTVEVRSKKINLRGKVAIYATRTPWGQGTMAVAQQHLDSWYPFPEGFIIATAEIVGCKQYNSPLDFIYDADNHRIPIDDSTLNSFVGKYGWELANIEALDKRIPYKMPTGAVIFAIEPEMDL